MAIEVKGHTGDLFFDGQFVTIRRRGFLARTTVGKGEKRIPVASISAVQWRPAGFLQNGFVEFSIAGGNESRSRFGHDVIDAVKNENAVVFTRKQMPEFERMRTAVEAAIASHHSPREAKGTSVTELLQQLADLKRQNLISPQEYAQKKAELLGRM